MTPNFDKIDDAVLALLHLTTFTEGSGAFKVPRAWKGHDWDALGRLHAKGYISNPVGKAKSVMVSEPERWEWLISRAAGWRLPLRSPR